MDKIQFETEFISKIYPHSPEGIIITTQTKFEHLFDSFDYELMLKVNIPNIIFKIFKISFSSELAEEISKTTCLDDISQLLLKKELLTVSTVVIASSSGGDTVSTNGEFILDCASTMVDIGLSVVEIPFKVIGGTCEVVGDIIGCIGDAL